MPVPSFHGSVLLSFRAESRNLLRHARPDRASGSVIPRLRPWNLSTVTAAPESLRLQCGLERAKTERHRGLDEPTSPFSPAVRGPNVGGQCSSCRFASPPPARGSRTFPFPLTSPHRSRNWPLQRSFSSDMRGEKAQKGRESAPSLPSQEERSHNGGGRGSYRSAGTMIQIMM